MTRMTGIKEKAVKTGIEIFEEIIDKQLVR